MEEYYIVETHLDSKLDEIHSETHPFDYYDEVIEFIDSIVERSGESLELISGDIEIENGNLYFEYTSDSIPDGVSTIIIEMVK